MTSISSESVATIHCTSTQSRFHVNTTNHREIDLNGVNITVTSITASTPTSKLRATKSARKDAISVLTDAHLLIKEGQRYALIGRNGTGKSTLLKAIAEKLIPGLSEDSRVAILQQSRLLDEDDNLLDVEKKGLSTLQEVVDRATSRDLVEREIQTLAPCVHSQSAIAAVRALRRLKHDRLQREHFVLHKDANLRSGERGLAARKRLVAFEKRTAESVEHIDQPESDISSQAIQAEVQEAADILANLELQVEPNAMAKMEARAKAILVGLGFNDARLEQPLSSLSGGWSMRASLAVALLQETDILILDEPTNFLDLLGIVWLQKHLVAMESREKAPTLIFVSHDRAFMEMCTDLIMIEDQKLTYFHGDLPTYEASQSERRAWLIKKKDAQDRQRTQLSSSIQQNLKAGKAKDDQNKIRQAKSQQKKLEERTGLMVNARGGKLKRSDQAAWAANSKLSIEVPPEKRASMLLIPDPIELRFPGSLLSLEKASFRYSARSPLILEDVTLTVGMGDRIGILGLNGSGKSTLIKLLVEETRPSSGTLTTHPRLKLGYYSQHAVDELKTREDPAQSALSFLLQETEGALNESEVRGLLSSLGLSGNVASDVPMSKLSGGQLVRCKLAQILWQRPHCLILDEVTTHLDYEAVVGLRDALRYWEGAVVLVTHDRWFMRGVVEGNTDDAFHGEDGSEDDEEESEEEMLRRREVYRVKKGKLVLLKNGVDEFESVVGRMADRMQHS